MLMFIYKKKEDIVKEVHNGALQQSIYEYLQQLEEDNLLYPQMCNNDLSRERICEYFDAEVEDGYIDYKHLLNPSNEIEILLNNIILAVYDRWENEKKIRSNKR